MAACIPLKMDPCAFFGVDSVVALMDAPAVVPLVSVDVVSAVPGDNAPPPVAGEPPIVLSSFVSALYPYCE